MVETIAQSDRERVERAVLAGLAIGSDPAVLDQAERSLTELAELARAAGAEVVGSLMQRRQVADPAYLIGRGKAEELRAACETLDADLVVFDEELTGSQIRNLEKLIGCKVVDRTLLILDIFASRAQSREGKLQVELAQQQYRLSRLIGMGQSLSRLGGGIGTRGPGETKLESDRRHINRRITYLKRALSDLGEHRQRTRKQRQVNDIMTIAVVGYTNAGKSTLINKLCSSDLFVMDQVFATLDPAVRRLMLPDQIEVLLIDTVGFIRKLPHHLVDAFHSTLEEVTSADAILQIVDVSDPDVAAQMAVVEALLLRLQAAGKPRLIVFNKIDVLATTPTPADPDRDDFAPSGLPADLAGLIPAGQSRQAFLVSAVTGEGIDTLLDAISELARKNQIQADLIIPYASAGLLDYICRHGRIIDLDYLNTGIAVTMAIKYSHFSPLRHFVRLAEKPEKR
ncbi:MAG: GTPase HflX [Saccharofermentanales bacterium]|jgi:GTP-binding protein HflX|nr:GTPase HflX [Clostridiaceae bacterium]